MKFIAGALLIFSLSGCNSGSSGDSTYSVVGSSSHDFLSASPYPGLTVEIQYVSGYAPSATSQSNLVAFLQARLNKPSGIQVVVDPALTAPGQSSYSIDDVRKLEANNRKLTASGSNLVAYFLFLDGNSTSDSGSSQILGQAYGASSMVLYEKTIQSLSGALGQPTRTVLESTVLEHEFGHILGLVNTGTSLRSSHQDGAHGAHCSNTSCLMYWEVDTSGFISNLLGGTIPTLDASCISDLQANGGK